MARISTLPKYPLNLFNPISDLETASKCPMLTECPFRAEQCQEDEDCSPDAVCCKSPCGKVCTKQLFTGKSLKGNLMTSLSLEQSV